MRRSVLVMVRWVLCLAVKCSLWVAAARRVITHGAALTVVSCGWKCSLRFCLSDSVLLPVTWTMLNSNLAVNRRYGALLAYNSLLYMMGGDDGVDVFNGLLV